MKRLCVLIPAKDERLGISKTLKSIIHAGLDVNDIYVVDDGSSDGTGEIARSFGVHVLRNQKNLSKALALSRGAQEFGLTTRYDYISLMDADTEVCKNYFDVVKRAFNNPRVAAVCGRAKSTPHNWLTAYRCLAYWISHAIYKCGQSNMRVITVTPGCASSFRADVFGKLDWNTDTIVEDMDCTIQIHRKKLGHIVYERGAVVSTQDPRTIRDYIKQIYRWDTGTWQVGRKYAMTSGLARIDWEFKLLAGEGLIFSALYLFLPALLLMHPQIALCSLGMDFLVLVMLACGCALRERRTDVLVALPLYELLRFIDCSVFLYSFWKTMVRGKQEKGWFGVKRY
ncbi:MAG: glycosyltransferase family 2 protein [Acidobacteria bacterium]|nr:glycosyltransferase family 2 protein [Acidobacteriota bacterium]